MIKVGLTTQCLAFGSILMLGLLGIVGVSGATTQLTNVQKLDEAMRLIQEVRNDISASTTPSATTPPATTTPTTPPGTSAASARNWGAPNAGDEFNYVGAPNSAKWGVYVGEGHGGNGRRVASAWSGDGNIMRVRGDSGGNTGGMAYKASQFRGKWETRMRAPAGDGDYHPVLLLWPTAEDWPVGGEVDYAEVFPADRQKANFFLHYGSSNSQTQASKTIDVTQWHNYAVEWTPSCMKGYIDNVEWFSDCNASHLPPRKMHMTIQLDAFGGDNGYIQSDMFVDWIRQYA